MRWIGAPAGIALLLRRIGAPAGIALLLGVAACAGPAPTAAAPVPVTSTGPVLNPVPAKTTTPARDAAPGPRRTSPAPTTAPQDPGAGSGNAGLDLFVAEVRRQLPGVALDRRDEEVEALGEQACAGLGAGKPANAVADELGEQDVTPVDARKLVTLAGSTACPGRPKVGDRA